MKTYCCLCAREGHRPAACPWRKGLRGVAYALLAGMAPICTALVIAFNTTSPVI